MSSKKAGPSVEDLVERHLSALYRFAYRLTGRQEDAEDLVQETFLLAQRKIGQLRDERSAFAWLITILRRRRCQQLERRNRSPAISQSTAVEEIADETGGEPVVEDVDPDRLAEVLAQMPETYREPLLLFYFEQLKYRQIAEILDCPIGTVMSRIARAKSHLRRRLTPEPCPDR